MLRRLPRQPGADQQRPRAERQRAADTVINVSSATPINSGSDWLRNDSAFATHISGINGTMDALATEPSSTNRDAVRAYLQRLRDGRISLTSLPFASTNIGGSRFLSFTLTNDRFLAAAFSVSKSGTDAADFTVTGCGLNAAGNNGSVPASGAAVAGSCTVSVEFSPLAGASTSRTAGVDVNYSGNFGGNPLSRTVSLSGTVPAASYNFTQTATTTSARFDLGQSSDVNVGTIANNGQATLSVSSILAQAPAPVGGNYTRITTPGGSCGATPFNLGAGASCTVWIRFTPTAAVESSGIFRITPSPGVAENFTLTGTGTEPRISPTVASLPFASTQLGNPRLLTQVVTNSGSAQLAFVAPLPNSPVALSGAHPGDFSVTGCAAAVNPGLTCTLNVTFTPTALGPRSATLTINSDGHATARSSSR